MEKILVINAGSATIKFKIFGRRTDNFSNGLVEEIFGMVERIGLKDSFIKIKNGRKEKKYDYPSGILNHQQAMAQISSLLQDKLLAIGTVGHRVVHGGEEFIEPTLLNASRIKQIEKYNSLAPLHNPVNLIGIKLARKLLPKANHYAIFDTAYFNTMPEYAYRYALPERLYKKHQIRRYGFHGTSHEYAAQEGAQKIKKPIANLKIITCHLGSGCSITATKGGEAVATSMGFTPLEGLMMSTRSGDIDPAIPLYLIDKLKMSVDEVDKMLNKESGLLGVVGAMDMREILAMAGKKVVGYKKKKKYSKQDKQKAKLALEMFIYNIVRYIGQYYAIMGGLDLLVFTAGVGERSPVVRNMVTKQIKHLGDFKSVVIPADEELMIARKILNNTKL